MGIYIIMQKLSFVFVWKKLMFATNIHAYSLSQVLIFILIKVLQEWPQFWNMSFGLIFEIVMPNYAAIRSAVLEKMTFEVAFLVVFRIFPNWNCYFRSGLWKTGSDVIRLCVLQSYRSCTLCKCKTRGETQFWTELAAPCTLANYNEINSEDTLPFIICLTSVSCDSSNRFWRQRLLLSTCSLWRHNVKR